MTLPKYLCVFIFSFLLETTQPPTQIGLNLNKATEINLVPFITTKPYMAQSSPTNNQPKTQGFYKTKPPKKLDQRLPTGTGPFPFPFPRLSRCWAGTDGRTDHPADLRIFWHLYPFLTDLLRIDLGELRRTDANHGHFDTRKGLGDGGGVGEGVFRLFKFEFQSGYSGSPISEMENVWYIWNLKGKYYWRYTHFSLSPMIMAGKVNHQLVQLCTNLHFFAFTNDIGGCQNPGSQWIATIYLLFKWSGKPFLTFTSSTGKPSV